MNSRLYLLNWSFTATVNKGRGACQCKTRYCLKMVLENDVDDVKQELIEHTTSCQRLNLCDTVRELIYCMTLYLIMVMKLLKRKE